MPRPKTVTVYVVQHREWEYNDEWYDPPTNDSGMAEEEQPGVSFLKTFLTRVKAEAHCQALERKARRGLDPFQYGGAGDDLANFSTLTPAQFLARLEEFSIEPPALDRHGRGRLWEWWNAVGKDLDEYEIDAVWDALDLVRFCTVVAMEVEMQA